MSGKKLVGFVLLLLGIGFFLQQADIIDFEHVLSNWWPALIILVGVVQLVYRSHPSRVSGFLFIIFGGLLLVGQFVDFNMWAYVWPLILIFAGGTFLFSRTKSGGVLNSENHIRVFTLFSGSNVKSHSSSFEGGVVTAVFGGAEIDLRKAHIAENAAIDMTAVFGGVTLFVPENTKVEITGVPIFGGWEDKTAYRATDNDSVLKIHCHPLFGGVEVKN